MLEISQNLAPGLHRGVPMNTYLGLEAIGSTQLGWLATSPLHFRHMMMARAVDTESTALGTAVHTAVLEPDNFARFYVDEPDPNLVAPDAEKPRATKAYREACEELRESGRIILKRDEAHQILAMKDAVLRNPHAMKLLSRAPEREITMIWERDGRMCRGRADMLGDAVLGDLKTTRSLKRFSPWSVTNFGYYRQASWYLDGLERLGRKIDHVIFVAVESEPPYDCGVFALDESARIFGGMECDYLMQRLMDCEAANDWPGMFPDVQKATVTDAFAAEMANEEVA